MRRVQGRAHTGSFRRCLLHIVRQADACGGRDDTADEILIYRTKVKRVELEARKKPPFPFYRNPGARNFKSLLVSKRTFVKGGFHPKDEIPYKLEFLSLNSINVAGFILFRYNICLIFGLKVEDFLHLQRVRCFR